MSLARLRIPTGWTVSWNTLHELNPDSDLQSYEDLTEDLFQSENTNRHIILDLGWYPEFSTKGRFVLCAVSSKSLDSAGWDAPLRKKESRSFSEIRDTLEEWLEDQSLTGL